MPRLRPMRDADVASVHELAVGGGVFVRGDVGPFRPYLPNGAYLSGSAAGQRPAVK